MNSNALWQRVLRGVSATCLGLALSVQADVLVSFPFNEGSGSNVTDTAQSLIGYFGFRMDPAVDTAAITPDFSPSGQLGDNSMTTGGNGFLMVDDSNGPVLDITNGPITMECWLYIDPFALPKNTEGILGYGQSYKMGMRGGRHVFTLFGIRDITNSAPGLPAGQWMHLAAAWEPGVGVHFYIDGVETFEADTTTAAQPPLHNYLSIGAEHHGNNVVGSLDRVRIHNALLTAAELDSDAQNPKAPLASTLVAYNFNESSLPANSAVAPARPTTWAGNITPQFGGPEWTSDTPSALPGDFALSFNPVLDTLRDRVGVSYDGELIPLGANNTNYTLQAWVKLPTGPLEERRVIFRGPTNAPRASLSVNANRRMHMTLFGNADFASSVDIPDDNRWHHLAAVMDDFSQVHFYLDGVLRQSMNRTATGVPNAGGGTPNLLVGLESDTRYFQGVLDRVRIDNAALTANQLDYPAIPGLAVVTNQPVSVFIDEGGNASFTAEFTSPTPATIQWHYRTNLADMTSVPIPGATSTTLNLTGVTEQDLGFYFLRITNAVGVTESHAGRVRFRGGSSVAAGFEPPQYQAGLLEDQDLWTTDQHGDIVRVLTAAEITDALTTAGLPVGDPVHGGDQALLISGSGLATATIRPTLGLENAQQVTLDIWARPLVGGSVGNVFMTMENANGTRAAAFRFGPSGRIDYGSAVSGVWVDTGLRWDTAGGTWYRFTMKVDYGTRTYDFFVDGAKVNTSPIAFYTATSEKLSQVRIFRGSNQSGAIFDDLTITGELKIKQIVVDGGSVNVTWEGGVGPFQLQRRSSLTTGIWENVGSPTNNNQASDTAGAGPMFYRVVGN